MHGALTSDDLKQHLKNTKLTAEWLFQVHVIQRRSFFFSNLQDGLQREMEFRQDLANSIGLSINEVGIVGSAQLGYSIKPRAKLRAMDELYKTSNRASDLSDVDVAIVSKSYFEKVHQEIAKYTKGFSEEWEFCNYYPTEDSMAHLAIKRADYQFYRYFAQGWIRPDFAPNGFDFKYTVQLNKWKRALGRKVSIGIYRDWICLKDYQQKAFENLRTMAIKDEL